MPYILRISDFILFIYLGESAGYYFREEPQSHSQGNEPMMTPHIRTGGILCAFLLLLATAGQAADPSKPLKQYVHSFWNSSDGLPENAVTGIAQTRDGYLWVSTPEGLARFNGRQFKIFDQSNVPEFNTNNIICLLEDTTQNALWIGTYRGGLAHYNNGHVQRYTVQNGLPDNFVTALIQDKEGVLWIGTAKGLASLRSGRIVPFRGNDELAQQRIMSFAIGPGEVLWAVANNHLFKLIGSNVEQVPVGIPNPAALLLRRLSEAGLGCAKHTSGPPAAPAQLLR